MKQMLNAAITLAATRHDGQYDKQGLPYIMHVLKVQYLLKSEDEELNCIAVLHDILEDTKTTVTELFSFGMSKRVVDAVSLLTKNKGEEYHIYLERIATNRDAIRVKMADIRHNMDLRRLKGVTEKDLHRMEKYIHAYNFLKNSLGEFYA